MSFSKIAMRIFGSGTKPVLEDENGLQVEFDAVIEHTRDKSSVATKHAVEGDDLTTITDHVRPEEPILNLKIVLSNHFVTNPFNPSSLVKTVKGSLLGKVDDTISDRIEILHSWADKGDLLKYTSKRITMDRCVLTKVGDAITKETGDGSSLSITLERINIANAAEINIELKKPTGARATKKKSRSLLKKIFS